MHSRKTSVSLESTWQRPDLRLRSVSKPDPYVSPKTDFRSKVSQIFNIRLSRRRWILFFFANVIPFVVCTSIVLSHQVRQTIWNTFFHSRSYDHNTSIANGTLGFEKIYTIGLPERFDKRDSIELAADVTGLQLTWVDGVAGNLMHEKSIPPTFKLPGVLPGVVGCWRSHMNVIRKMVREKISSAVILEDDADWDVHIVWQMQKFADATRELLKKGGKPGKNDAHTGSPYGEGWDILWIGHCGGFQANTASMPHYIIRNDQTVPPTMDIEDMLLGITPMVGWDQAGPDAHCSAHAGRDPNGKTCDSPRLGSNERIVQERAKPVCTASYAISLQGARKMLARLGGLSLQDIVAPLDQGMGDICSGGTDLPGEQTRCFTPSPPYFRGYKPKGPLTGDSDIRKTGENGEKRDVGWSKGIVWSARLNADTIVSGINIEPESQYMAEGPKGEEQWRYRKATEYTSFKEEAHVNEWIWH